MVLMVMVIHDVVHQEEVIEPFVEPVALKARIVIHQRPVAAQFLDKDAVAQTLRSAQLVFAAGQLHAKLRNMC